MAQNLEYRETGFGDLAQYYLTEYPETADHDFLRRLVSASRIDSILEIPCGAGRNLSVLAESGASVVAVDLSEQMVEQVQRRFISSGLLPNVTAEVGDMRQLRLGRSFDLIVVPREAFQLIVPWRSVEQAMACLASHLLPGGSLMIDVANFIDDPRASWGVQPDYYDPTIPDGDLVTEWERRTEDGHLLSRSRVQRHVSVDLYETTFTYRIVGRDGARSYSSLDLAFRRYSLDLLVETAGKHGLVPVALYSDYDGRPPYPNAARTIGVFARG